MSKHQNESLEDTGTPELSRRHRVVPMLTRGQYGLNPKVVDETEIDRMLLVDAISPAEHASLENLLRVLVKTGYAGMQSPSYEAPVSSDPATVADKKSHTIMEAASVMQRLHRTIGRANAAALVNLVLLDVKWPFDAKTLKDAIPHLDMAIRSK